MVPDWETSKNFERNPEMLQGNLLHYTCKFFLKHARSVGVFNLTFVWVEIAASQVKR